MRNIKVITDSCSDLSPDLLEKYDLSYAKMYTIYEGEETRAMLDWTREDARKLYDIMRGGNRPTTTQVPVEEFDQVFRKYLEREMDIIYVGCSSKQSGSVNTAYVVANKLMEEYPNARIAVIDSLNASGGEGVVAIEAAKKVAEGKDFDTVVKETEAMRNNVLEYVTVHTLDMLKKAGRVKASKAFIGNLMGVKPILISDADGEQTPVKKARGRQNSLIECVKLLKENIIDPEEQTVYVNHADCSEEEVTFLTDLIKKEIPCKDVHVALIGPIIGSSIGPEAFAIFALGKEVTYRVGAGK